MEFSIKTISDLEKLSHQVKWQYFEKLAAFIFSENGFDARQNVIVKGGESKRQFDVIAKGNGITFLVECKKWKSQSDRAAHLRSAVTKHMERCIYYSELHPDEKTFPILVPLLDDDVNIEKGVPIVPIMKLNAFLLEIDEVNLENK